MTTQPQASTVNDRVGQALPPRRSFATRLFGYDLFISFALDPTPRGTQSYASDLARRLREQDFAVFFSEDEASPSAPMAAASFPPAAGATCACGPPRRPGPRNCARNSPAT